MSVIACTLPGSASFEFSSPESEHVPDALADGTQQRLNLQDSRKFSYVELLDRLSTPIHLSEQEKRKHVQTRTFVGLDTLRE